MCSSHIYERISVHLLTSVHYIISLRSMDQDDVIVFFFHVISIIYKKKIQNLIGPSVFNSTFFFSIIRDILQTFQLCEVHFFFFRFCKECDHGLTLHFSHYQRYTTDFQIMWKCIFSDFVKGIIELRRAILNIK